MIDLRTHVRWCTRFQWAMGGMMLAILLAFYVCGYKPEIDHLHQLRNDEARCQAELIDNQSRTRVLPAVIAEVAQLREQIDQSKKLPPQQEMPQFLKDIAALGQASALHDFTIKPGMPSRGDLFDQMPINLSFDGDFVDVYSFLRHTSDMQRLTRIVSMAIKQKDGLAGKVDVQLSMNIYFAPD